MPRPSLKFVESKDDSFHINFKFIRPLYNEKHSTTYVCEDLRTHKMVVIKENTTHPYYYQLLREINILQKLKHDGIIKMLDYHIIDERNKAYIILEYIEKGDLYEYFEKCTPYFTEGNVIEIIRQLINSITYCHANGVCHRDIKLENILLNHDNSIKLIDFGLSVQKTGTTFIMSGQCGSPDYMAPEVLSDEYTVYDEKCDVWSIGVVLYILTYKQFPFEYKNIPSLKHNVAHDDIVPPSNIKPSDDVVDLLGKMLCKDPSSRISITEASEHVCFAYAI